MDRNWYTRLVIVLLVALGTLWLLVPSYYSFFVLERADRNNLKKLDEALPAWAPPAKYRLSLGLDLQGGIHMVMRVDTRTALMKRAERRGLQMANWVQTKKLGEVTSSTDPENLLVTLTAKDPATMDAIEKELVGTFEDFSKESRNGASLVLRLNDAQVDYFMNEAVEQAMLVIRKRIDKWGVAEVDVRRLGTDSIQISLPGQSDPEQAKELIGTTAQLEFRLVDENPELFKSLYDSTPPEASAGITLVSARGVDDDGSAPPTPFLVGTDREALAAYVKGKAPEGKQILLHCVEAENGKSCTKYYTFLVGKDVPLTGDSLTNADASQNPQDNSVQVNFQFDAQGAQDLEALTGNNVGKRMAIVLDDNVVMAPTIQEKISGGSGRITLGRRGAVQERLKEAQMLALALKAGALPAPVTTGEIRQVGASLGDELIKKGTLAAIVGLLLVVVFMAIYYKLSGLIADVALILNGALILGGLALFGATLTLPGIAGFVLTLGIAVDANVLINERVREELAAGKSARTAIDNGYDRAFWTIFDAHVTTLIAGFILMSTGTGPIRGFATSLIIGIIASLFTSIVVTRLITTWVVHGRNAETVSI
ncbi:MAG: protein translocase subunit SecD [Myxococcota bacterium]|jgi:preprotein translocase subunit SecD